MNAPTPQRDAQADALVGQVLGDRFAIKRAIGVGHVATVYLAQDVDTNRRVVVKAFDAQWADESDAAAAHFVREARRLGEIDHPNVAGLVDHGSLEGRPYLVFEYVDGELLDAHVQRKGRLDLREFVPVASQLLKAVGYAHMRGLALRDLRPRNVALTSAEGRAQFVKMLDFGLADLLEGSSSLAARHRRGGEAFVAPERSAGASDAPGNTGEDGEADLRADVFALGAIFHFMLTGAEALPRAPLAGALEPGHDIPEEVIALIETCLSTDPGARPEDANAIVEALIDAVPDLSLFRLPRVAGSESTGIFNVGGVGRPESSLLGAPVAPALERDDPATGRGELTPVGPVRATIAEASSVAAAAEEGRRSRVLPVVALASLVVVVGGVALLWPSLRGDADGDPVAGDATPADTKGAAELEPRLAAIGASIDDGAFDEALAGLDLMSDDLLEHPAAQSRAAALRVRAEVGKLMAAAEALEAKGELEAARDLYLEVLGKDAAHVDAKAGAARLAKALSATAGKLTVHSTPAAEVTIDGKVAGTTPFDLELQPGEHELVLSAEGYLSKTETVTVEQGEKLRVSTSLRRAAKKRDGEAAASEDDLGETGEAGGTGGTGGSDARPKSGGSKTSTPKAGSAPKQPAVQTPKTPEKSDPFLPASKSGKSDGFLPAKK